MLSCPINLNELIKKVTTKHSVQAGNKAVKIKNQNFKGSILAAFNKEPKWSRKKSCAENFKVK